jgi:molybdopterin converting factor small subunit
MYYQMMLFASLRDKVGQNKVIFDLEGPLTVSDLLAHFFDQFPQVQPFQDRLLITVNQKYASPSQIIYPEDEIALFPPVSGG